MGTIANRIIGKASLILLNTFIFSLVFHLIISTEKITGWSKTSDLAYYTILLGTFCLFTIYNLINNTITEIIPKKWALIYIIVLSIIFTLSLPHFWLYIPLFFLFLFFYCLILKATSLYLKKILIADILTFAFSIGAFLLFTFLIKTNDNLPYFYSLAFSYFGIFHFILTLLNVQTLSKTEVKN